MSGKDNPKDKVEEAIIEIKFMCKERGYKISHVQKKDGDWYEVFGGSLIIENKGKKKKDF